MTTNKPLELTKEQIKEQAIENYKQLHQQWVADPTTQMFHKVVNKFLQLHVANVSLNVSNPSLTDAAFRQIAVNIQNTNAILELMTNPDKFIEYLLK